MMVNHPRDLTMHQWQRSNVSNLLRGVKHKHAPNQAITDEFTCKV
jgi:hypothetical protein